MTTPLRLNKTFILSGKDPNDFPVSKSDVLAINRDLENVFLNLQNIQTKRITITGSRGGNAALASLLTALDALNIIKDSTTA